MSGCILPERRVIPMVLRNRKLLKLIVCISLIVALAISALSLSAGATYENTHNNSGDQAQDIVSIAETQVGYYEGYDGYTKYGDWYGMPNADWCAMFVSWCANQAGVDTDTFKPFALCSAGADYFISQGNFQYSGSYVPKAGDLIFYASYGNIYHVGLVTGSDGYNVYSIEGNYNEMVSNVSYSLSYGDTLGYATPSYMTGSNGGDNYIDTDSSYDTPVVDSDVDDGTDSADYIDSATDVDSDYEDNSDTQTDSDIADDSDIDTESDVVTTDSDDTDTASDGVTTDSDDVQYQMGDVNGDGMVSVADAIDVQRHVIGLEKLSEAQMLRADVDGSGELDLNDVIGIMEQILLNRVQNL